MMNPLDDLDVSPTHVDCVGVSLSGSAAAAADSARDGFVGGCSGANATVDTTMPPAPPEREMIFYRRPDISGRQLLFQPRRGNVVAPAKPDPLGAPPVQLLALDGRTFFGIPAAEVAASASHARAAGGGSGGDAAQTGGAAGSGDGLSRLLVTTNALCDAQSKRRIRQLQLAMLGAAAANVIMTAVLLYPDGRDAWFHTDAFSAALGVASAERVRALRPSLLALAILVHGSGVAAAVLQRESLLTLYIFALVAADIFSLLRLLPHMFFLLRFFFDVLLALLAAETRSHLEHAWFVTNFQRLRY